MQELVRALLGGSRPGGGASGEHSKDASQLYLIWKTVFKASLDLLGQQESCLSERQAADLVSVLDLDLPWVPNAIDTAEARSCPWPTAPASCYWGDSAQLWSLSVPVRECTLSCNTW